MQITKSLGALACCAVPASTRCTARAPWASLWSLLVSRFLIWEIDSLSFFLARGRPLATKAVDQKHAMFSLRRSIHLHTHSLERRFHCRPTALPSDNCGYSVVINHSGRPSGLWSLSGCLGLQPWRGLHQSGCAMPRLLHPF